MAVPAFAAAPANLTLNYTVAWPLSGDQPMKVLHTAELPAQVSANAPTGEFTWKATLTFSEGTTAGFALVGAKTVEGSMTVKMQAASPAGTMPIEVELNVAKTAIPATGPFEATATGTIPPHTFAKPGNATYTAGDLTATWTPKAADGTETGLGTFQTPAKLDAGQNNKLATTIIAGP